MKNLLLLCGLCLAGTALVACSPNPQGDTNLRGASETTDTRMAPGTSTSTDPNAAIDQAARSTDPYATPDTPLGGTTADPARTGDAAATNTGSAAGTELTGQVPPRADADARADPTRVDDPDAARAYPTDNTAPAPNPPTRDD